MKNYGVALLCTAGVVLLGLLAKFPYSVWVIVDLGVVIVCGITGMKLVGSDKK